MTMNQEKMKFWLTCPYCKRKFGVFPVVILKYVDRLFSQLGQEIEGHAKKLQARRMPEPPANLPVAEE